MQILQILLVIISAIGNLWPFWTPIWCQGCPQKGPKFMICPKWETVSNLWWEIVSLYKFAASGGEGGTFREMGNFLTPRVPQKGSKLMICPKWGAVWNLWSKIISLCKFPASVLFLEGWVSQNGSKYVVWQKYATIEFFMQNFVYM